MTRMYWGTFKINIFLALVGVVLAQHFPDLSNLGQSITSKVQEKIRPLQNLGSKIQASVDKGLEPVRAMEMTYKMKGGVGGYTVATHLPEGRKFIMLNNQPYTCTGAISSRSGRCKGQMIPFEVTKEKENCYLLGSYSIINNHICIGANSMSIINNNINCVSHMGTQGLLLTLPEFRKLCAGISDVVAYKYTANPKDPAHVELPSDNPLIKCSTQKKGVCVFTETQPVAELSGFHGVIVNRNGNYVTNVVQYN